MKRSTILSFIGAIGVVATSIMVAKAAPKAEQFLKEMREDKGGELTTIEKIKAAGPIYIPSIAMGTATIACIFGANVLNGKNQAALTSAYALADRSYKEYKNRISEDAQSKIKEIIAKDQYEDDREVAKDKELFFDFNTLQYFEASLDDVLQKVTMDDGMECYIIAVPIDSPMDYI